MDLEMGGKNVWIWKLGCMKVWIWKWEALKGKFSANERGVKKKHFGTRNTAVAVEADYQLRIKCY